MSPWPTAALGTIAAIERSAVQPEQIRQGTSYVGLENIEAGGTAIHPRPVDAGELASSKFRFTDRHILYGKLRPYLAKIVCPEFSGICSTDIVPILPGPMVDRRYLLHFLRQPAMVEYASSRTAGANLPRLSPSVLASFEVPLAPLTEQRRIACVLDRTEALRAKRRAALAELDSLTQSIFLDMFGDPAKNHTDWPRTTLGDVVVSALDGPHVSPNYTNEGVPFISTRHVRRGQISWEDMKFISQEDAEVHWKKCKPTLGDVLYTKGGTTGLAAAVTTNKHFAVWVHVAILRPDPAKVDTAWLESMLNTDFCYRQSQRLTHGIANHDLGLTRMLRIEMPLPPLHQQREYSSRKLVVEQLRRANRASLAEMEMLFSALEHRAFDGNL